MKMSKRQQSGFTMIELIMVIVILGILSSFALPKFADLGSDARSASVDGLFAAVKSASGIAHAAYLAGGSSGTTINMDGLVITLVDGYPSPVLATVLGIDTAAGINDDNSDTCANSDYTCAFADPVLTMAVQTNCHVTYDMDTGDNQPVIAKVTSGC